MVVIVEAAMAVQGVVILGVLVEVIQAAQVAVVIPAVLLQAVIGEGVHRIVRVVLVRPAADLLPCLKKK